MAPLSSVPAQPASRRCGRLSCWRVTTGAGLLLTVPLYRFTAGLPVPQPSLAALRPQCVQHHLRAWPSTDCGAHPRVSGMQAENLVSTPSPALHSGSSPSCAPLFQCLESQAFPSSTVSLRTEAPSSLRALCLTHYPAQVSQVRLLTV